MSGIGGEKWMVDINIYLGSSKVRANKAASGEQIKHVVKSPSCSRIANV